MLASTRRAIQYPNPDRSDRPDIPAHILNLVNALEIDVIYVQGTDAQRLAANHLAGVLWYATDTQLFWWDTGTTWIAMATPVAQRLGYEWAYVQITAPVTGIAAITEATSVAIMTTPSVTYDGTRVKVEFWCPNWTCSNNLNATLVVYRDTTPIGQASNLVNMAIPQYVAVFDTPSAAAHTYTIKGFVNTAALGISAGPGGSGQLEPAFLRVTKA